MNVYSQQEWTIMVAPNELYWNETNENKMWKGEKQLKNDKNKISKTGIRFKNKIWKTVKNLKRGE